MSIKPEQVIIKKEKDHPNASAHAHFTSKDDCITLAFNIGSGQRNEELERAQD